MISFTLRSSVCVILCHVFCLMDDYVLILVVALKSQSLSRSIHEFISNCRSNSNESTYFL